MGTAAEQLPTHLRVAEQGKLFALAEDYARALGCYRIAMRLAAEAGEPKAFFRHYLECLVEALELDGEHEAVLEYCARMEALHEKAGREGDLPRYDRAALEECRGIVLLKMGRNKEAQEALEEACARAREAGARLPLAETVLRWMRSRLTVGERRLLAEQRRHRYFSVRPDTVREEIATRLTDREIFGAMAAPFHPNP